MADGPGFRAHDGSRPRWFAPTMDQKGRGWIINIGSIAGYLPLGALEPPGDPQTWSLSSYAYQQTKFAAKRNSQAEDMCGPVLFLASDDSAMVNGQVICVDGGNVMPA